MKSKYTSAFSLLEIIVSGFILSLVVAGLFGLFITSSKFIIEAQHRSHAINYARMVAENLKVYVSADPNTPAFAGTDNNHALDGDGTGETHNPSLIGLNPIDIPHITGETCTYQVIENITVAGTPTDLEQVIITVQWTEP